MQILKSIMEIAVEDILNGGFFQVKTCHFVARRASRTLNARPREQHELSDGVGKNVPCFTNSFAELRFLACRIIENEAGMGLQLDWAKVA